MKCDVFACALSAFVSHPRPPQAFKAVGFELTQGRLSQENLVFSEEPWKGTCSPWVRRLNAWAGVWRRPGGQGLRAAAMTWKWSRCIQFQSFFYQPKKVLPHPWAITSPIPFLILGLKLLLIYLLSLWSIVFLTYHVSGMIQHLSFLCLTSFTFAYFSRFLYVVTCVWI